MILLIHNHKTVVKVSEVQAKLTIEHVFQNPMKELFRLAEEHPDSILVWCHESQKNNLDIEAITSSFCYKNMMLSYSNEQYLPLQVGYVEDSPFLKVNKKVKYPTWLMSSNVGAIYANQLVKFKPFILVNNPFDYSLNSIAKIGISKGLFCYSEPKLLKHSSLETKSIKASISTFFKFVKQHYKARWIWLLLLNYIWHEKKLPLYSTLKSFFYKRVYYSDTFKLEARHKNLKNKINSVDVIIPTIGRKKYLYNVLKCLTKQNLTPNKVIIVEQNPDTSSVSELDYLKTESWPFKIEHIFIHQTGACNARNLALEHLDSKYVFFADDDILFNEKTLEEAIGFMSYYNIETTTLSCLRPNDKVTNNNIFQWKSFGSGCSIATKQALTGLKFNMVFEHGFGEDTDFGMQLRNKGVDIVYNPEVNLTHLKAPIGGFRVKYIHPWENDEISPKPSPTVMLNRILNTTKYQLLGYKITLFIKFYKKQNIINPITYYNKFKKQWKQSVYWANKLNQQSN